MSAMFSQRHYEFLANEIGVALARATTDGRHALNGLACQLGRVFPTDNAKFNWHTFTNAITKAQEREENNKLYRELTS